MVQLASIVRRQAVLIWPLQVQSEWFTSTQHFLMDNRRPWAAEFPAMNLKFKCSLLSLCRTYLWYDEKGKKNRCPAPQYIDYVMTYTQRTISDESYFPTKYANQFPTGFESHVRKMLRLLFHVIAHMYAAHFREIAILGLHPHLNSTYALLVALQRWVKSKNKIVKDYHRSGNETKKL